MGMKEFSGRPEAERSSASGGIRRFGVDWNFSEFDAALLPPRQASTGNSRDLEIFHINDFHARIYNFSREGKGEPVFSRIVTAVRRERERHPNGVLFFSAGDDATGSPMDHLAGYNGTGFTAHPAYSAYSLAGMDAAALGNHDFDFGLATLKYSILENASFPVLSANLEHGGVLDGLVFPAAILCLENLRVGVIGLTTQGQMRSRPGSFYEMADPLPSYRAIYRKIAPVCDTVILLSHLGRRMGSTFAVVKTMGDVELAEALGAERPALIVGGHTHDLLNRKGLEPQNLIGSTPILQAGCNGEFLGRVSLVLDSEGEEACACSVKKIEIQESGNYDPDPGFESLFCSSAAGSGIEALQAPLRSFPLEALSGGTSGQFTSRSSGKEVLGRIICDALLSELKGLEKKADLVLLDETNMIVLPEPGDYRFTIQDVYRLMPYADTLSFYTVSGVFLQNLMEDNNRRAVAGDRSRTGYLYCSGNLVSEAREIGETSILLLDGEKVNNADTYTIAAPNYIQGLAGAWEDEAALTGTSPATLRGLKGESSELFLRKMIIDSFQR